MLFRFCSWICALILSSSLAQAAERWDEGRSLFDRLSRLPSFQTSYYTDEARIVLVQDDFYAVFATVSSPNAAIICAYAAPFPEDIGQQPGAYTLRPQVLCGPGREFELYTGLFAVKVPPCGGEFCANPAIGVGNLLIRPSQEARLGRLPARVPVEVEGIFRGLRE